MTVTFRVPFWTKHSTRIHKDIHWPQQPVIETKKWLYERGFPLSRAVTKN
jgi:hypothetical protein